MPFSLLSLTSPAPPGFTFDAAPGAPALRRRPFCLYSEDPASAISLIGRLVDRASGLVVAPGPQWNWRSLGTFCSQWTVPESIVTSLSNLAIPYLQLLEQARHCDDKAKAQAWDLQRAAQDRLFLSKVQLEVRDAMLNAEGRLRAASQYLNQIIEFLPDATLVIDREKKVVAWNKAMESLTGVGKDAMLGKGNYEYALPFYGERRPILVDLAYLPDSEFVDHYAAIRHIGNSILGEVFVPKVSGGKGAHLMGSASLLHDQDGNIVGAIETIRDITEHHQAMEQLRKAKLVAEEANQAKSTFLSNVSHEIRTPLNGIIGFAELIMHEEDPGRIREMARTVVHQSEILLSLVNAILDQARIESGKMEIEYVATDLSEVLRMVTQTVGVQAKKKGITIGVEGLDDVPRLVLADGLRVCQVLLNLLNNAVKFTEKGGVVLRVAVQRRESDKVWTRFDVVDTGSGIPNEKKHLIFRRFAQVDAAATRKHGGAGLGLSLAQGLVDLMGGTIGFESQIGKGTTFWFVLPFSVYKKPLPAQELRNTNTELKACRSRCSICPILLVEDYEPNQDVARMHLESAGYKVEIAENGVVALEHCDAKEYSLILMDIQMPELDGFEATRRLRQMPGWTQNVVILGLSANADEKTRKDCLAAGMDGLVTKPLRRKAFLAEVAQRLSDASSEREDTAAPCKRTTADDPMDPEEAIREFGGNRALLRGVVVRFLAMARNQLADMKRAVSAGDAAALGREAHKIKGASANITAMRLSEAAKALEEKTKSGNLLGAEELLARAVKELDDLDRFVGERCCSLGITSSGPRFSEESPCES